MRKNKVTYAKFKQAVNICYGYDLVTASSTQKEYTDFLTLKSLNNDRDNWMKHIVEMIKDKSDEEMYKKLAKTKNFAACYMLTAACKYDREGFFLKWRVRAIKDKSIALAKEKTLRTLEKAIIVDFMAVR